jgi:hypothetical protein
MFTVSGVLVFGAIVQLTIGRPWNDFRGCSAAGSWVTAHSSSTLAYKALS